MQRLVSIVLPAGIVMAGAVPYGMVDAARLESGGEEPIAAAAEASDDPLAVDTTGLGLQELALVAIDFDPWLIEDGEIPDRRQPVVANRVHHVERAAAAAVRLAEAQTTFDAAERTLAEAQQVRDELELDVEAYAVRMWVLGDDGLQQQLGSEVAMLRQSEPLNVATTSLVDRVNAADAALAAASEAAVVAAADLAVYSEAASRANRLLMQARQIEARFSATIVDRNEAISKWTHDVLDAESEEVDLVRIESVVVRMPETGPGEASGEGLSPAGVAAELDDEPALGDETDAGAAASEATVNTVEMVVAIQPIVVNREIAANVAALLGAARSDGIELSGWGFREREMQIVLRRGHCGTSGYALFEKPAGECSPPTARPGHSEHELGLAIDFTEGGVVLNSASPGFAWLVANGADYGLINLPSEAWHWSTTGH